MAIFRGVGGSGDSSDNSFLQEVTAQAQSAEASATSAANSLATIQNTEVTSASFDTGDGVLTLTKTGGATVTADLDGRFLTSYTETNDLSTAVTWANVPDANITESSVTQYLTAANVTSPLTGGTGISIASNGTITNDSPDQTVALTGTGATTVTGTYPNFTIDSTNTTYTVGDGGLTTNDFTDADHTKLNGIEANATADQTGAEIKSAYEAVADTNAYTDAEKTKLSGIEASADVTDTANVTAAGALMDSEVTNLAQVKAFDSSDYLTSHQDISGKANLSGASFTGNVNIGIPPAGTQSLLVAGATTLYGGVTGGLDVTGDITVTGTVDGRDVATDGAKLDGIDSGANASYSYSNQIHGTYTNLTTIITQIGSDFYLRNYSDNYYKRFLEFSVYTNYFTTSSTNDLNVRIMLVVPSSSGNAVDVGSVETVTTTGTYNREVTLDGDVTHWFSDYAGIGVNSNGGTPFTGIVTSVYNPSTDKTTLNVGVFGASLPSVGSSIYVHPFDWETAGSEVFGNQKQYDAKAGSTSTYIINDKVYFGNINRQATCRIKMWEAASSDNVNVQRIRIHQTDERT